MRAPHVCRLWPERRWLPLIVMVGVWFVPLLRAHGQAPPDEPGPRAQFGTARAVDSGTMPSAADTSQPPARDAKEKKPDAGYKEGGVLLYAMPLTPPPPDRLFRLDSEETFRDRLRDEVRQRSPKIRLEFPDADAPAPAPWAGRAWPAYVKRVEPNYVVSKRLFFEQPRFERYGESLGAFQPGVSATVFGFDLLVWPARLLAQPFRCYQVNTDCYSPYFQAVGE